MPPLINGTVPVFEPGGDDARLSLLNRATPLAPPPTAADATDANLAAGRAGADDVSQAMADAVGRPAPTTLFGVRNRFVDNPVGTERISPELTNPSVGIDPIIGRFPGTNRPMLASEAADLRARAQDVVTGTLGLSGQIEAYHGSPHNFERFDLSRIGTGEGAQAYGHGLYFADSEGVARSYRDALSPPGVVVTRNGQPVGPLANSHIVNDPQYVAAYNALMPDPAVPGWIKSGIMRDIHGLGDTGQNIDLDTARQASIARMTKEMAQFSPEHQQRAVASINQAYDSIGGDVQFRRPGHMYEVNIDADPAHFLDWDKPLSEQSPHVQQALTGGKIANVRQTDSGYVVDYTSGGQAKTSRTFPTPEAAQNAAGPFTASVREWAASHADAKGGDYRVSAEQSQALKDAGIPGIRYLDAGSRGVGEGSRNTVVFDDNLISILRKYGIAGLFMGGGAAAGLPNSQDQQP